MIFETSIKYSFSKTHNYVQSTVVFLYLANLVSVFTFNESTKYFVKQNINFSTSKNNLSLNVNSNAIQILKNALAQRVMKSEISANVCKYFEFNILRHHIFHKLFQLLLSIFPR